MSHRLKSGWMVAALVLALATPTMAARVEHTVIPVWPHLRVATARRTPKIKVVPELGKILFPPVRWPTLTEYLVPKSQANGCALSRWRLWDAGCALGGHTRGYMA